MESCITFVHFTCFTSYMTYSMTKIQMLVCCPWLITRGAWDGRLTVAVECVAVWVMYFGITSWTERNDTTIRPAQIYICMYVCLSVCRSVYLSVHLSVCLSIYLSVHLSVCLSIHLSQSVQSVSSHCVSIPWIRCNASFPHNTLLSTQQLICIIVCS